MLARPLLGYGLGNAGLDEGCCHVNVCLSRVMELDAQLLLHLHPKSAAYQQKYDCSSMKLPALLNHALNTCLATDMYFQGQFFSTVELS